METIQKLVARAMDYVRALEAREGKMDEDAELAVFYGHLAHLINQEV